MAFRKNQHQQVSMGDDLFAMTAREKKFLSRSWAEVFSNTVFPAINEDRFSVLYSSNPASRPNTPVNVIVGALILRSWMQMTDDEIFESLLFDTRFRYALHTTSYEEQPISECTLPRFRERNLSHEIETGEDLIKEEMLHLSEEFAKVMKLTGSVKRMDSLMIASHCKRMSRLEILYTVAANAVRAMHRLGMDEQIPVAMLHYLAENDRNRVIYHCKDDEAGSRLQTVIGDLSALKELLDLDGFRELQEYQLLLRALREQTKQDAEGKVIPKENSEITSDSLQNPSDPDATYREKAGKQHKGYVGNVTETVGGNGDSLVTDMDFRPNTYSDSQFCKDYIAQRTPDAPEETLVTDGAYFSIDNAKAAAEANVELVSTALTGKETDEIMADFVLSDDQTEVVSCPMGHAPVKTTYYPKTGVCRARFNHACCANCPNRDRCHAKEQRKTFAVHVSGKTVARAAHLRRLKSEAYQKLTHLRNGVESIPSLLRRCFNVDRIPVFGLKPAKLYFNLDIGALNFSKLLISLERQSREKSAQMA